MEFIVVGAVVALVSTITVAAVFAQHRDFARRVEPLAKSFESEILTGWRHFFAPRAVVYHGGLMIVIRPTTSMAEWDANTQRKPAFNISAKLGCATPNFRVRPIHPLQQLLRWLGRGIRLGDSTFDEKFLVTGSRDDLAKICIALDHVAQNMLLRVHASLSELRVSERVLQLQLHGELQEGLESVLLLMERLNGTGPVGLHYIESESDGVRGFRLNEETKCPVCGESIAPTAPTVCCRKCQVPHHRDCWAYVGKCAVYACGDKFTLPRK